MGGLCAGCLSVHVPAFLALKETGAGPEAAWAKLLLLGNSSSLGLQTPLCFSFTVRSMWGTGTVESHSPRGTQPSGRCSGAGPGCGLPLDGGGELRLGVNCI